MEAPSDMNAKLEAALAMANNADGNSPNTLYSDTNANCHSDTTSMKVSSAPFKAPGTASSKRGPGYTITEDLLICRAFIAASKILSLEFLKKEKPSNARCTPTTSRFEHSNQSEV
jgi:hypothetical protein